MRIFAAAIFTAASLCAAPGGPQIHRRQPFQGTAGAWLDTDYTNRVAITIDSAQVSSTLTNFPVYIDLSDLPAAFFSAIQADGDDIRASDAGHTATRHIDTVRIDTSGQTGEIHVLLPTVSSSVSTVFYLYYNCASCGAYSTPEDVWDATGANFMAVYHMDADGNLAQPSATGVAAIDADSANQESGDSVAGKMGNAIDYDGSNEYNSVPQSDAATYLQPDTSMTMSAWFAADDFSDQVFFGNQMDSTSKGIAWWIWSSNIRPSITSTGWTNLTESTSGKSAGTWYHVAATWDGITGRLYFNGSEVDSHSLDGSHSWALQPCYFARRESGSYYDGKLDEVRLHDATLSADWISAEYTNQNTPTTFYTVGTPEAQ